jgi:hypothetical protein
VQQKKMNPTRTMEITSTEAITVYFMTASFLFGAFTSESSREGETFTGK